jgi:hypothetical protein
MSDPLPATPPVPTPSRSRVLQVALIGCGGCLGAPVLLLACYLIWANWLPGPPNTGPSPPLPQPNGYDAVRVALAKLHVAPKESPLAQRAVSDPRVLRPLLAQDEPVLDELRHALKLDYLTPPIQNLAEIAPLTADRFRDAGRKLAAESRVELAEGHAARAEDAALDVLDLGSREGEHGAVLHALIGCALVEMGCRAAEPAIYRLNAAEVRAAGQRLDQIIPRFPSIEETVTVERGAAYETWLRVFSGEVKQNPLPNGGAAPSGALLKALCFCYPKPWTLDSLDHSLTTIIRESRKPYPQRLHYPPPREPLSHAYLSALEEYQKAVGIRDARLRLIRLELALVEYGWRHRQYPDTLDALRPEILSSLPDDPFRGGPFTYRRTARSYVLSSWGPDAHPDPPEIDPVPKSGPTLRDDIVAGTLGAPQSQAR